MTGDLSGILPSLDPALLSGIAGRALGVSHFEVTGWTVTPLQHEKVLGTTGGLYWVQGQGREGAAERDWSVVLKVVTRPEQDCREPRELCFWQRELLAYQSGILANLPPGLRAPRCYGVSQRSPGGWIWLELVREDAGGENPPVWTLADFGRAARHLGRFSGAYLTGTPLPDAPWMCPSLFRAMLSDEDWWARFLNPASPNNAWQRPVVQAVFPDPLRARVLQIWADKWRLIEASERLPRVFCHNDAHRRNLFLCAGPGGQEDLVAIDWAFCGSGCLGSDLGQLVGTSLSYFAVEPDRALDLEAAVLEGYQAGLRDAGWSGDPRLARLGYTLSLALYWGATLPSEAASIQPGEARVNVQAKYGRPLEAVLSGWSALVNLALDRADEARYWAGRLV